jgi:hypothetical protein
LRKQKTVHEGSYTWVSLVLFRTIRFCASFAVESVVEVADAAVAAACVVVVVVASPPTEKLEYLYLRRLILAMRSNEA